MVTGLMNPHPCGCLEGLQLVSETHLCKGGLLLSTCLFLLPFRSSTNELAVLVSRMQKNADQVEKDILETQAKLKQVTAGQREGWQCRHETKVLVGSKDISIWPRVVRQRDAMKCSTNDSCAGACINHGI